jgi:hypothetical protein
MAAEERTSRRKLGLLTWVAGAALLAGLAALIVALLR